MTLVVRMSGADIPAGVPSACDHDSSTRFEPSMMVTVAVATRTFPGAGSPEMSAVTITGATGSSTISSAGVTPRTRLIAVVKAL